MFGLFSKKITQEEYDTLTRRLLDVNTRLLQLETSEKVFRDKVLRKVQKARELDDESEDINTKPSGGILGYGIRK